MATKKRSEEPKKAAATTGAKPKRKATRSAPAGETAKRPTLKSHAKATKKPRIHSSYALIADEARDRNPIRSVFRGEARVRTKAGVVREKPLTPPLRRVLGGPKRTGAKRPAPVSDATTGPGAASRELALALATEGIEKKAMGIEILDVTGKIDYADFLVIMTGRSDRHVHAIASGLEEAMTRRKSPPMSVEGLSQATWVLLDFSDVVVHVFQEDARALYDIEGLWIEAGRVPVPDEEREHALNNPTAPHYSD